MHLVWFLGLCVGFFHVYVFRESVVDFEAGDQLYVNRKSLCSFGSFCRCFCHFKNNFLVVSFLLVLCVPLWFRVTLFGR